jgi:hypothetical protein
MDGEPIRTPLSERLCCLKFEQGSTKIIRLRVEYGRNWIYTSATIDVVWKVERFSPKEPLT